MYNVQVKFIRRGGLKGLGIGDGPICRDNYISKYIIPSFTLIAKSIKGFGNIKSDDISSIILVEIP
jgi:hypothetical protein